MLFVDKLASCAYLLVGLTRLRGTSKEDELKHGIFVGIVAFLCIVAAVAHRHPVRSSLPASLFLFFQVILICKSFDAEKGKKYVNKYVYVILITAAALLAYIGTKKFAKGQGDKLKEFLFNAQSVKHISDEMDEDINDNEDE